MNLLFREIRIAAALPCFDLHGCAHHGDHPEVCPAYYRPAVLSLCKALAQENLLIEELEAEIERLRALLGEKKGKDPQRPGATLDGV